MKVKVFGTVYNISLAEWTRRRHICIYPHMPNRSVHTLATSWTFSFMPLHIFLAFYARHNGWTPLY